MEMKTIYLFFACSLLVSLGCQRPRTVDTNPASLAKHLGVTLPNSAKVIAMAASVDDETVLLQAKFSINLDDFHVLARLLNMHKADDAYITPQYAFEETIPGNWWAPPDPLHPDYTPERYRGSLAYQSTGSNIIMIWFDGVAYIHNFGRKWPGKY